MKVIINEGVDKFLVLDDLTVTLPVENGDPVFSLMMPVCDALTREQQADLVGTEGFGYHVDVNEVRLKELAMSILQNTWWLARRGELPAGYVNGHQARISAYEAALEEARHPKPKAKKIKVDKPKIEMWKEGDPERVAIAHLYAESTYRAVAEADVKSMQPWINKNAFRKGMFKVIKNAPGPLKIAEILPLFVDECKMFHGNDGGKSQGGRRLRELIMVGLVEPVEVTDVG
jgi:hypothetical protein